MMWQEARKQERKIRGMLVDYKRRAERRKDYYEKIKADPTQFIQIHGRPCKIHLDPAVAIAGDSPANMMSWQGNQDILIDRFDVRAHLDYIPDVQPNKVDEEEASQEDRQINYERYRILAQNDFLGVSEEKFLHQLSVEEQFGPVEKVEPQPIEGKKKVVGATIGYNYNEGASTPTPGVVAPVEEGASSGDDDENEDDDEDEDSDIDFDLCVDVNKISSAQAHEMNASALSYGMMSNDFFSFLTRDVEEAETLKMAREREEEKAMFSGRKSRRERRAFREKKLLGRKLSPPSYAASKDAPIADLIRNVTKSRSRSRSRSTSPPNAGMIQYITSFGGEEPPLEPPPPQSIKTSVHSSKKEESNVYKRTVRYKSSRSPESNSRRHKSRSVERSVRYRRSWSREKGHPDSSHRSRSRSPKWRSKSPSLRRVRYRSRSRSRSPNQATFSRNEKARRENKSYYNASYRKRQSYSRSKSPSPVVRIVKKSSSPQPIRSIEIPAPPVITRYYGRHKTQSSSSELDLSDSEDKSDQTSDKMPASDKSNQAVGNAGGRSKPAVSTSKVSLQERLKKKRQALINRQYKADKRAERLRQEKAEQERQDREDEMREISIKMRRRERQKRHQYYELDESNAAENSDEDRLSAMSSGSCSDKPTSDSEQRSKNRSPRKTRDSRERDRSRGRDSRRDSDSKRDNDSRRDGDSRRDSDSRRDGDSRRDSDSRKDIDSRRECDRRKDRERSSDRDKRPRRDREEDRSRGKDDERSRGMDRSRDRIRDRSRSREKERCRRDRDRSRDRGREKSKERERNSYRRSLDRDSSGSAVKKPIRPLVDY